MFTDFEPASVAVDENENADKVEDDFVSESESDRKGSSVLLNLDGASILNYVRDGIIGKDATFEGPFGVRKGKAFIRGIHSYLAAILAKVGKSIA